MRSLNLWSSNWKYRNDADVLGLRNGCTFTGFSSTNYQGEKVTITAGTIDRWVVFRDDEAYSHMDEDIESFQCFCRQ